MLTKSLFLKYYPDSRRSGTIAFYEWVRLTLRPEMTLLDLGAGPGAGTAIRSFRGTVAKVIGADIDPIVLQNPDIDHAILIAPDKPFPLADECVDIIVSDYVFEHVEHREIFLAEAFRVLKPGGRFYFRTPNLIHYVAIISLLTPHHVHLCIANRVRALETSAHDPYPTRYRLNLVNTLRRQGILAGFSKFEYHMWEAEPSYLVFHWIPLLVGIAYERLVNSHKLFSRFRGNIFGFFSK